MTTNQKGTYRTLSSRARGLLQKEEGIDVEFKESLASLSNEDLVAFANSAKGGAILIGVRERRRRGGRSYGEIKGCIVGEGSKRKILNKAESCVPPLDVFVVEENTARSAIYRIEIPSGADKPYSTSGGTYKIREDGKNKALLPGALLSLFLSKEQDQFVSRFQQATRNLSKSIDGVREHVVAELNQVDALLEDVFGSAQEAEQNAAEATGFVDETLGAVQHVAERVEYLEEILDLNEDNLVALLKHFDLEDARSLRYRRMVQARVESELRRQIREHPKLTKARILSRTRKEFPNLTDFDYAGLFDEVQKHLNKT